MSEITELRILQMLSLPDLKESKFNPRRDFGAAGLKELADSMRAHGVLEPLLVRPMNGQGAEKQILRSAQDDKKPTADQKFEIVVGARRFRAAKLAKLESLPAIVRELSDTDALEIQIIENLQREDVQPLDEGLGYRALIDHAGYDVAKVAEKIGKSQSYVYQRLKLADLSKPAQKALAEGKINAGHAVQIARLQPAIQEVVLKSMRLDQGGEPTVRELGEWIQENVHRNLDKAPWKKGDASLLPKAGPCDICPKRAGTNPQAFPDLKPQTCTDPDCFRAKGEALVQIALKAHPGAIPISASRFYELENEERAVAKKSSILMKSGYGEPGWKPSTADACLHTKEGVITLGNLAALGHITLICAEEKCPVHGSGRASRGNLPKAAPGFINEERRKQVEELWQRREKQAIRFALHEALRKRQEKMTTMPIEALRFAVERAHHSAPIRQDARDYSCTVWKTNKQTMHPLENIIEKADQITLLRLLLDFPLLEDVADKFSDGKEIALAAKAYGLPIEKITAGIHKIWAEKKQISYAKRDARLAAEKAKLGKAENPKPEKKPAAKLHTNATSPKRPARKQKPRKAR